MEQPRIVFNNLLAECTTQMRKQLKALEALQNNEDEALEEGLMAKYEEEKAKTINLDIQLKEARLRMLN